MCKKHFDYATISHEDPLPPVEDGAWGKHGQEAIALGGHEKLSYDIDVSLSPEECIDDLACLLVALGMTVLEENLK